MKNKKNIIFLVVVFVILIVYGVWKIFYSQKINDYDLSYGVIYDSPKSDIKSFLYADDKKIYYLNGYNPLDVFIVTSSINNVEEEAIIMAQENIQNGKMDFVYTVGNRINVRNILPAVYDWLPTIDDLKKQIDIIEEKYDYKEYSFVDIICNENEDRKLYYTDQFGRKIYTEGVDQIYVEYDGENYELQTVLEKNNSISDNVYLSFRKDPRTIITSFSSDDDSVIEAITQEGNNMYLRQIFSNNEIFYVFRCM